MNFSVKMHAGHRVMMPGVLLAFVIFLGACTQRVKHDYAKQIPGEWNLAKVVEVKSVSKDSDAPRLLPPNPGDMFVGYVFYGDGRCESKAGFFKQSMNAEGKKVNVFLGTTTKYEVKKDSLYVWNLSDSVWAKRKIYKITPDTMILESSGTLMKYVKVVQGGQGQDFDEVLVSSYGCRGTCPVNDVLIKSDGEMIYYGDRFNTREGYFKGHIKKKQYVNIAHAFQQADFMKMKDDYPGADGEAVSVTFVQNGKIIKSIYAAVSNHLPIDFYYGFTTARYMYQRTKLDSLKNVPEYLTRWRPIDFEKDTMMYAMNGSESFYLWSLLLNSKEVQHTFKPEYTARFSFVDNPMKIMTDGRYYMLTLQKGKQVTLDLGFNFFGRNKLIKKFKVKNE